MQRFVIFQNCVEKYRALRWPDPRGVYGFVNGMDAPSLTGLPGEIVHVSLTRESSMTIKTIGLDLGKV